jgi:hypothetical protein
MGLRRKRLLGLQRWLVFALVGTLVAFSCALFIALEDAQAKGKSPGDSGQLQSVKGALGAATEPAGRQEQPVGGSDGNNIGNNGRGGGGGNKESAGSTPTVDRPRPASVDSKPVLTRADEAVESVSQTTDPRSGKAASGPVETTLQTAAPTLQETGGSLGEAAEPVGKAAEPAAEKVVPIVESETQPVLKTANEAFEPAVEEVTPIAESAAHPVFEAVSPAVEPALEETARTIEPVSKTIASTVEPIDQAISPRVGRVSETTEIPEPLLEQATTPIREAGHPVLETTAPVLVLKSAVEPVVGKVDPLVQPVLEAANPVVEPVLREAVPVLGIMPLGEAVPSQIEPSLGAPAPAIQAPAVQPALGAIESVAGAIIEPMAPTALGPPFFGEGTTSPSTGALFSPSTIPSSSVLGAVEETTLNPRFASSAFLGDLGDAVEAAASYRPEEVVVDESRASTTAGLFLGPHFRSFDSSLRLGGHQAAVGDLAAAKSTLEQTPRSSPFSTPPLSSSLGGSGLGIGLALVAILALLLTLVRVGTLSWSLCESFSPSSSLQLAIERPG